MLFTSTLIVLLHNSQGELWHIFEVELQILFWFSMKLAIDLFQWESSLTDYVTELHSSPLQKIWTLV